LIERFIIDRATCKNCSFTIELKESQAITSCPNCGVKSDLEPVILASVDSLSEPISESVLSPHSMCPVCCSEILPEEQFLLWQDIVTLLKKIQPFVLRALHLYKRGITTYATFHGRDSREEFSCFALVSLLINILLIALPGNLYLVYLYWGGTFLQSAGILVRRLQDTGLSPWYILTGPLLLLLLFVPTANEIAPEKKES